MFVSNLKIPSLSGDDLNSYVTIVVPLHLNALLQYILIMNDL